MHENHFYSSSGEIYPSVFWISIETFLEILTQTKLTLLISAHYLLLEMIRSLIIIVILFSLTAMNFARSNNHEASVPTEDDNEHHHMSFMRTGITFTEGKKVFVAQDCRDVTILEVDEDTKKVNRLSYEEIKEVLAEKLQQG